MPNAFIFNLLVNGGQAFVLTLAPMLCYFPVLALTCEIRSDSCAVQMALFSRNSFANIWFVTSATFFT